MTAHEVYIEGVLDGIRAYAWMRDGVTYVGTTGKTLSQAIEDAKTGKYPPWPNVKEWA